jgi:hypothetical protein
MCKYRNPKKFHPIFEVTGMPFFQHWLDEPQGIRLWLYSERGVISCLFHHLLSKDPGFLLNNAHNFSGQTLGAVTGLLPNRYTVLTEFCLGTKHGFGCPDGALLGQDNNRQSSFVFIEAKAIPMAQAYQDPAVAAAPIQHHNWQAPPQEAWIRHNTFNSSINGQIELKWRFANALQAAVAAHQTLVTEQRGVNIPDAILNTDRFYWRHRPYHHQGQENRRHWRRVQMKGGLHPLYRELQQVGDRFYLLCLTHDSLRPAEFNQIRFFDPAGSPQNLVHQRIFWMPYARVCERLGGHLQ